MRKEHALARNLALPAKTASIVNIAPRIAEAAVYVIKFLNMECMQEEKIFYQDSDVTITQSRFIANDKTYAMRNISSVSISKVEQSTRLQMAILTVGCLIAIFSEEVRVIGIIIALGCFIWIAMLKNNYAVRISTNSGETNSLVSENKKYIQKIVNSLNDAIIFRG